MTERGQGGLLSSLFSTPGKLLATPGKLLGWQRQANSSPAAQRAEASGVQGDIPDSLNVLFPASAHKEAGVHVCRRRGQRECRAEAGRGFCQAQARAACGSAAVADALLAGRTLDTDLVRAKVCMQVNLQQWLLMCALNAVATALGCLQETKAESSPAASSLQHTLLQQTSGWESEKHAALERFFNRQQPAALTGAGGAARGMQARPVGKLPTAVFGAFYDIIKNPPKAGGPVAREPENGPLRHATRTSRYNPYARPQARTGAGHMNR